MKKRRFKLGHVLMSFNIISLCLREHGKLSILILVYQLVELLRKCVYIHTKVLNTSRISLNNVTSVRMKIFRTNVLKDSYFSSGVFIGCVMKCKTVSNAIWFENGINSNTIRDTAWKAILFVLFKLKENIRIFQLNYNTKVFVSRELIILIIFLNVYSHSIPLYSVDNYFIYLLLNSLF